MPPRKRTVAPGSIKNLADWLSYWPSTGNVGFDPVTREPAIYSNDSDRKKLMSIPWRREVDTITILSQPNEYAPQIVSMAEKRYESIKEQQAEIVAALEEQLQAAEELVLEEWNAYKESLPAMRSMKMTNVVKAEKALVQIEKSLAEQKALGAIYVIDEIDNDTEYVTQYTPPMPLGRRGIPFGAATVVAAAAAPILSTSSADDNISDEDSNSGSNEDSNSGSNFTEEDDSNMDSNTE